MVSVMFQQFPNYAHDNFTVVSKSKYFHLLCLLLVSEREKIQSE